MERDEIVTMLIFLTREAIKLGVDMRRFMDMIEEGDERSITDEQRDQLVSEARRAVESL